MTDQMDVPEQTARDETPEDSIREVIGEALSTPQSDPRAATEVIIGELARRGLIPGSFEWAVRSEMVHATFDDPRAAAAFVQHGDGVERRTTPGPWMRVER